MQAKIIDRKWVVEWFDERQCYHMPSLTLADNGNLLAVWNGGFLQWNGDPMGRDAKDWVSVLGRGREITGVVYSRKPGRRQNLDAACAHNHPQ